MLAASFVFFCLALVYSLASPISNTAQASQCAKVLKEGGVSEQFAAIVAHGIHTLTVEDLRKFEPDVTEKNMVPTVNLDLNSDKLILLNAPDRKVVGETFKTDGLKAFDQVLNHMDDQNYDVKGYSTLERVVHALHMHESWYNALQQYLKIKANPPSAEVCQCARDVQNNGILEFLRYLAYSVRDPTAAAGKRKTINGVSVTWGLGGVMRIVQADWVPGPDDKIVPLKNQAAWQLWRKGMLQFDSPKANDHYELALYLYCALQPK